MGKTETISLEDSSVDWFLRAGSSSFEAKDTTRKEQYPHVILDKTTAEHSLHNGKAWQTQQLAFAAASDKTVIHQTLSSHRVICVHSGMVFAMFY